MASKTVFACTLICCARVLWGAYSPAGTVVFADLNKIAASVATLATGPKDIVLKKTIPSAIRQQPVARLFGPMRPGATGVAVCYVDAVLAAKLGATQGRNDALLDRAKRWTVFYPATLSQAAFMKKHPEAKYDAKSKTWHLPPGPHSHRDLWVWFSADGQWVALGPSAAMTAHTPAIAMGALKTPLGADLARVNLTASGAHVVFGSDVSLCSGGTMCVRLTSVGLEVRGVVMNKLDRRPLPLDAFTFRGVPPNAVEFGASTEADDIRSANVFLFAGPQMANYVKRALSRVRTPNYSLYYLKGAGVASDPATRFMRLMPEAKSLPVSNVMFCSLTHVLKLYLPVVSRTMAPVDSMRMQMGVRLLRPARGDGMAFATWRDKGCDRFLMRVSRDDLRGTANLWALSFE